MCSLFFNLAYRMVMGWDRAVCTVTGYGAGWSRDQIAVGVRFFTLVQTDPGALPASCTVGTRSYTGVKRPGCGADHPPILAPRSQISGAIPLLPLRAFRACYRVKFTLPYCLHLFSHNVFQIISYTCI
jgi:hypothetical protein